MLALPSNDNVVGADFEGDRDPTLAAAQHEQRLAGAEVHIEQLAAPYAGSGQVRPAVELFPFQSSGEIGDEFGLAAAIAADDPAVRELHVPEPVVRQPRGIGRQAIFRHYAAGDGDRASDPSTLWNIDGRHPGGRQADMRASGG